MVDLSLTVSFKALLALCTRDWEQVRICTCFIWQCRNSLGVPVFEKPPSKYSAMRIMSVLLDSSVDERKVAYTRPVQIESSSSFVINLTRLAHPDDIKKDSYGTWLHKGSHTDVFKCSYDKNGDVNIEKAAPGATGQNVYYLRRLHSVHHTVASGESWLSYVVSFECALRKLSQCTKAV